MSNTQNSNLIRFLVNLISHPITEHDKSPVIIIPWRFQSINFEQQRVATNLIDPI